MKALAVCSFPALAATLLALAACSSTPEARYTPGNIDRSASDASGTAIQQADAVTPAEVREECKDTPPSVKSRVEACNPPKEPQKQPSESEPH